MIKNKRILILGSAGQLGKEFVKVLAEKDYKYVAPKEDESSITDFEQMKSLIDNIKPEIVINCAAYNAVDQAEIDPDIALLVNGQAVENLVVQCKDKNIFLVHFGSDYVFDGKKQNLYSEQDPVCPLNVYGKSKLAGEQAVIKHMKDYLVFRLSWVFGDGKQNFLYKLAGWAEKNPVLKISADEVSVPTYTSDVVDFTLLALDKMLCGLYHLTNSGYASRYELARYFVQQKKLFNILIPVSLNTFESKAERPFFTAMSNENLSKALGVEIPSWQDGVERYLEKSSKFKV